MVMIEAMACGTPVVALRGGAVPEVVVDGVTGFIRDSPDELPAALARVHEIDPVACRDRVEREFSATRLAAGYEAAYRVALARRPVDPAADPVDDPLAELRTQLDAFDVGLDWAYQAGRRDAALGAASGGRAVDRLAATPADPARKGLAVAGGGPPTGGIT
jgi:hypothetical protein